MEFAVSKLIQPFGRIAGDGILDSHAASSQFIKVDLVSLKTVDFGENILISVFILRFVIHEVEKNADL